MSHGLIIIYSQISVRQSPDQSWIFEQMLEIFFKYVSLIICGYFGRISENIIWITPLVIKRLHTSPCVQPQSSHTARTAFAVEHPPVVTQEPTRTPMGRHTSHPPTSPSSASPPSIILKTLPCLQSPSSRYFVHGSSLTHLPSTQTSPFLHPGTYPHISRRPALESHT